MLASAVFASLAVAGAYAAPVLSNLVTVEAALSPSNITHYNASVESYFMNGNAGACGLWDSDSSLVAGLPLEQYTDLGSVSPFCGSFIVVVDPRTNVSVTARVSDASTQNNTLSLSQGSWTALNGTDSSLETVNWRFANTTETADAKAALESSSSSTVAAATSTKAAAASSSAYVAPSSSAEKKTSTSTYVAPSSTSTSAYVAPSSTTEANEYKLNAQTTSSKVYTTTSAYVAPTTTTTTKAWVAPSTTTTTQQAAATVKSSYSSSSSSGSSYSGTATYFYQNGVAGACGTVHSDSDYIVALQTSVYNGGSHCGQQIKATANGKSVTLTVADECPSCVSSGSIDLSESAFLALASLDAGVASVSWSFV